MTDLSFYRGKRIFVTGHTGFKGAWLCEILLLAGAEVVGYALEPPTDPSLYELAGLERNMRSIIGDVRDFVAMKKVFDETQPEIVFHLAAQPIVRTGYERPRETFETNIMGTVNLMECVRTAHAPVRSVVNITTDKVYLNRERQAGYREDDPLDGYDPYSNSKSCSELATHAYHSSFFQRTDTAVSTARAGNVIGGGDFARDRIIPDCIRAALEHRPIIVHNPNSIRPYQHVLEPLFAYLMIARRQYEDRTFSGWYNVGPDEEDSVTTGTLAEMFCRTWGDGIRWIDRSEAYAPHEATYLRLDCAKLKETFGWVPRWHIDKAVLCTVEWAKAWRDGRDIEAEMEKQILEYADGMQ